MADETGEVQYATQTVTVTERDSKALGQPVGSSTTVLLTAYPGGHSGGVDSEANQPFLSPPTTTTNVPPNVQVVMTGVYSSKFYVLCLHIHIIQDYYIWHFLYMGDY